MLSGYLRDLGNLHILTVHGKNPIPMQLMAGVMRTPPAHWIACQRNYPGESFIITMISPVWDKSKREKKMILKNILIDITKILYNLINQ